MRNYLLVFIVVLFVLAGCAKKEIIKSDGALPPSPSKIESKDRQGKAEPSGNLKNETIIKNQSDELKHIANAGEIKAALEKIYFDFDSYALSSDARKVLLKNSELMKNDHSVSVQIQGNCDERGSAEYNIALGEKRANAAKKYMLTMGIPEERLSTISYGKEKPIVAGHDENSWAQNRRDEFVIDQK